LNFLTHTYMLRASKPLNFTFISSFTSFIQTRVDFHPDYINWEFMVEISILESRLLFFSKIPSSFCNFHVVQKVNIYFVEFE